MVEEKTCVKAIITNYDKIKNMTIDEMAEFITRSICLSCIYIKENRNCKGKKCISGIKQWLKKESEQ